MIPVTRTMRRPCEAPLKLRVVPEPEMELLTPPELLVSKNAMNPCCRLTSLTNDSKQL